VPTSSQYPIERDRQQQRRWQRLLERTQQKPRRRNDARRRDRVVHNGIFIRDSAAVSEPSALPDTVSCLGNCECATRPTGVGYASLLER
jgi:hypothetical protein